MQIGLNQIQSQQISMRGKFEKFKKSVDCHYDEGENKVYQILNCLEQLHHLRLIQKIARPIPYEQKETFFQSFKQKFLQLHFLLENLQKEIPKQSENGNDRHKGGTSTLGVKQKIKKQDIRKIQSTYREVLLEGSFKFFYLVAKIQGLPLNLQVINIQQWVANCLEQPSKQSCC